MIPTSCRKNSDLISNFTLVAEGLDGDAKLAVNGATSDWVDGETLNINGSEKEISVSGGVASISNVQRTDYYRAVYPAGIVSGSLNSNSVTVSLPAVYQYQTSGGSQIVASPMAAYLEDDEDDHSSSGTLQFQHITGALAIRIWNDDARGAILIDSIIVRSSNSKLNGTFNISDISNLSISGADGSTLADRSVAMVFEQETLSVPEGSANAKEVQIPVPCTKSGNAFTIVVVGHNTTGTKYRFSRQQASGHAGALGRNQIGYVPIEIRRSSGYVTVSPIFKVEGGDMLINNANDYMLFVEACNNGYTYEGSYRSKSYKVTAPFSLSGYNVVPVSNFTGSFNGNNQTISDITITGTDRVGMFNTIPGGVSISNVKLSNVTLVSTLTSGDVNMGALIGFLNGSQTVSNCTVNGIGFSMNSLSVSPKLGGLIGYSYGPQTQTITNCTVNNMSIIGSNASTDQNTQTFNIGGFIGSSNGVLNFSGCNYSNSNQLVVYASKLRFGGLVGCCAETITGTGCTVVHNAKMRSGANHEGGLIGRCEKSGSYNISASGTTIRGTILRKGTTSGIGPIYGTKTGTPTVVGDPDYSDLTLSTW